MNLYFHGIEQVTKPPTEKKLIRLLFFSLLLTGTAWGQTSRVQDVERLAERYFASKEFAQAEKLYASLSSGAPENTFYFDRHWTCLYELGNYALAHDLLAAQKTRTGDAGYLDDMARMSLLSGNQKQAEQEWKLLLESQGYNPNSIRAVGMTMMSLKRYDLAKSLFLGQRSPTDPGAFNQELIHLYTQTADADGIGTEFLYLLKTRPDQDGLVESRISQYFGDSLSAARILSRFSGADSAGMPPSFHRILGTLYRLTQQPLAAFDRFAAYDRKMKNGGSVSWTLINSLSSKESGNLILQLGDRMVSRFPESQFRIQTEVKMISACAEGVWFSPELLKKAETLYTRQGTERDAAQLRDGYLKTILNAKGPLADKQGKIRQLISAGRVTNRQYWEWVLAFISGEKEKMPEIFKNQQFRSTVRLEYILTSLADGIPADSLRSDLFSFARDLRSADAPAYLFFLIQSVPVPAIRFDEFRPVARGLLFQKLGLKSEAISQFSEAAASATDPVVAGTALAGLWEIYLQIHETGELLNLTRRVAGSPELLKWTGQALCESAPVLIRAGYRSEVRSALELLIGRFPESVWSSRAREILADLRIKGEA